MDDIDDIICEGMLDNIDSKEIIKGIINEFNLKPYKYVVIYNNPIKIKSIIKKYEKELNVDFLKWDSSDEIYNIISGDYITDDLSIVLKNYPFLDKSYMCVIFTNDPNTLKEVGTKTELYAPGMYMFSDVGGMSLHKIDLSDEIEPIIDVNLEKQLQLDIDNFFDNKKFFVNNNLTFKRGLLFYGTYGVGKTTFIKHVLKKQKDCYCIIMDCAKHFTSEFAEFMNIVAKGKKKIIVFEDVDKIQDYNKTTLFNFLDGINVLEDTIVIATTNNIEELDGALIDRPSRFDRLYHFDLPNEELRKEIIKIYFKKIDFDLNKAAKLTKGYSGAYLKELFVLTHIQNCTIFEAIENINKQRKLVKDYKLDNNSDNYFG